MNGDRRVALITGASSGIGYACAQTMAQAGYDIIVQYHKNEIGAMNCVKEAKQYGCKSMIIMADISHEQEVKRLFRKIIEQWGRIDTIINCAGIFYPTYLFRQNQKELERMTMVNAFGCVWVTKIGIKYMIPQRRGSIVNISSVSSIKGMIGQSGYSLTKGGINAFSQSIAREAAGFGINVNVIAPGYIETNITNHMPEDEKKKVIEQLPAGRFGKAEDVAKLACFLSDEAANYIVGQIIAIDGGYSI